MRNRYEEPKSNVEDKGTFESVELVWLRDAYSFEFEAAAEDNSRPESTNTKLLEFLKALTGWNLLVVFSAKEVAQHKKIMPASRKGPADVLCFQRNEEKRIAIRSIRKDESTIEWMTATVESSLDISSSILDMTLKSRQKGSKLALAMVTATEGNAGKSTEQSEHWRFRVNGDARDVDCKLNGYDRVDKSKNQR